MLGDVELKGLLQRHFGIGITRRYVSYIRRQIGIPPLREWGNGSQRPDNRRSAAIIH